MLYLVSGVWPQQIWRIFLALLPVCLIGACVGLSAGLLTRRTLPAFVISLVFTLGTWILGSSFGLSSGFGGVYETLSRFIPNTYTVDLIFPSYYFGVSISPAWINYLFLGAVSLVMLALLTRLYLLRLKAGS
jgi:ABC-type multidrug transport system permease subunit